MINRKRAQEVAMDWHGGQGTRLYAFGSSGYIVPGLVGDIQRELLEANGNQKRSLNALLRYINSQLEASTRGVGVPVVW